MRHPRAVRFHLAARPPYDICVIGVVTKRGNLPRLRGCIAQIHEFEFFDFDLFDFVFHDGSLS